MQAQVHWMTASALWEPLRQVGQSDALRRPALLRFASDTFMEGLDAMLRQDPSQLINHVAQPESFQARPLGAPANWSPTPPPVLKLYQPAHGHFYLVACSLICRLLGFPDHRINTAQGERVSFLLRRLVPVQGSNPLRHTEYAWVVSGQSPGWQPVASPQTVAPQEERLPLFGINFPEGGRTRRLLAGLLPVASRETFQARPELTPIAIPPASEGDPRLAELQARVEEPLAELLGAGASAVEAQQVSLFILLDLADFLSLNLATLWSAVLADAWSGPAGAMQQLFEQLRTWTVDSGGQVTWRQALAAVWQQRESINATGTAPNPPLAFDLRNSSVSGGQLRSAVAAALGPYQPPSAPAPAVPVPKFDPAAGDLYVVRCVYERPQCGPWQPPLVSLESQRFQLASFFDPDAPARPIRIALPGDTSIAGLRKFDKNVAFMMSKQLREQMSRLSKQIIVDGTAGAGASFELGHICALSIPIITLCAFILLFVIVTLLNIVFWWLPFFKICFPLGRR
jgi:hypothetical protein